MQTVQSLIFIVLLIAIFYFMLVRPQKRRVEQHQSLLESIDVGDEIVTIGGLHGTVRAIGDEDVEIEAAPGVTLRFVKNAIARRVSEDLTADEDEASTEGVVAQDAAADEPATGTSDEPVASAAEAPSAEVAGDATAETSGDEKR